MGREAGGGGDVLERDDTSLIDLFSMICFNKLC